MGMELFECLKLLLVAMTEQLFTSMPSFIDNENIGSIHSSDNVGDVEVSLFEADLTSVKQIYKSWISAKALSSLTTENSFHFYQINSIYFPCETKC
jgi:hypothetical protein